MKENSLVLFFGIIIFFSPILVLAQAATTTENLTISVTIAGVPPPPPWRPAGPSPLITKIIFEGRAYPSAFLTLLKDGKVSATFSAQDSGLFKTELSGLSGGNYAFGIWAEDIKGRKSVTLNFALDILEGTITTISGIFISPTIEIFPTQLEKGQTLDIFGQAFPGSDIHVFISPKEIVKETKTSIDGKWEYNLDSASLDEGEYVVQAKAFYEDGEQSLFSQELSFLVLPRDYLTCWGPDLNFDDEVNIIDFSILLYFWEQKEPENRCADINFDGIVDIVDFSIMMYWWTD